MGKSDEELLPILKLSVENALEDNDLNKEDYYIKVTNTGVIIKNINNIWIQKSDYTVVKGDTVLNIGDDISYDETCDGAITDLIDVEWKVLGAEEGELLIMSNRSIEQKNINTENSTLQLAKLAYENTINELNNKCASYGKGKYAVGARSITVEDIDRVTGYDKTTYGKDTIEEYGNIVTYLYNKTVYPSYSASNGVTTKHDMTGHANGFHWYDEKSNYHFANDLTKKDSGTITDNVGEAKITNTFYGYVVKEKTNLQTESLKAYNMLFGENDDRGYWLASKYVLAKEYILDFGMFGVHNGEVQGFFFLNSEGKRNNYSYTVCPVVILSANVKLSGSSETGWNIV